MIALADCRLYGILDLNYVEPAEAEDVTAHLIAGGVDVLQLRAKDRALAEIARLAALLHRQTAAAGIPIIINDHAEIVRDGAGDGVHVGQDDAAIAEVRAQVGREIIVGKSTHSLAQAKAAAAEGADYIGFGPLFATPTKPDYPAIGLEQIEQAHREATVPIFCIGGIKLANIQQVVAAGARRVVIVSGLLQSENIEAYAKAAKAALALHP